VPSKEAALIVIVTPAPLKALNDAVAEDAGAFPIIKTPLSRINPFDGRIKGMADCSNIVRGDGGSPSRVFASAAVSENPGAVEPVLLPKRLFAFTLGTPPPKLSASTPVT
jgi:hypothetical protein